MRRKVLAAGLCAAAGTALSAGASLIHGDIVPVLVTGASTATGLAAYLPLTDAGSLAPIKKGCGSFRGTV
jgi:hypothetical protein